MSKKLARTVFLLVMIGLALLLASCEYVLPYFNTFYVDDIEYDIDKMVIASKQDNGNGSWELVILLMTEDLDFFPERTDGPIPLDGSGEVIRLWVNSPASSLVEGTYDWDTEVEEYTLTNGTVAIAGNYDRGAIGESDSFFRGSDGTVWISETILGDFVVDFELDGYDTGNDEYATIEGHYRGDFDLEEWTLPVE